MLVLINSTNRAKREKKSCMEGKAEVESDQGWDTSVIYNIGQKATLLKPVFSNSALCWPPISYEPKECMKLVLCWRHMVCRTAPYTSELCTMWRTKGDTDKTKSINSSKENQFNNVIITRGVRKDHTSQISTGDINCT